MWEVMDMPLIYCRSPQRRKEIVEKYLVTPIAQLKLINNRTIESCAGGTITDSYYVFHCVDRNDPEQVGEIYCGYVAARHLCHLIEEEPPRLFNPLLNENDENGLNNLRNEYEEDDDNTLGTPRRHQRWNPAMKELSNAINILLLYWPQMENSVLESLAERIRPYPHTPPYAWIVKSVNTMLRNHKTTIREILTDIERENGAIRNYTFEHLIEILDKEEDVAGQYFEPRELEEPEFIPF